MIINFPNKKYDIIYADPPWRYKSNSCVGDKSSLNKKNNFHYPTMTNEEIYNLPIYNISKNNCLLFLWVVSPKLKEGIITGEKWGFVYSTIGFVWEKEKCNPGYYTLSSVEICLIFKKGNIPIPRGTRNERQFLYQQKTKHSVKPDEIRQRIERMFPMQKKIELFSRNQWPGWDVWGNESNFKIQKQTRQGYCKQGYLI